MPRKTVMPARSTSSPRFGIALQQLTELLNGQSGVLDNPAQRESLDRIVPRNRDLTGAIAHHDVLALANDREPCLFRSAYRVQVIDSRNLWHG